MRRTIGLAALAAVLSLVIAAAGSAAPNKGSGGTNNGGNTPGCGAACDQSHNPTDYTKPCNPVPGNGCHQLPDTPCERGHGGTEIGNKHCGPDLVMLKEQSQFPEGSPDANFTHGMINGALGFDFFYRITVTNFSNTQYTLLATDQLCDSGNFAFEPAGFSDPQPLAPFGTDVFYCQIDAIGGAGLPGDSIPDGVTPGLGEGPFPLSNTATITATPDGGGTPVTLTDSVTANFS
ncbi:MAG TPA: hypothetical protein VHZ77_01685 [Gaiellaceae bacterium]|jgi:hypothetical protein|nr:hypothetical protein [Gaiellaceae bacterium]